MTFRNFFLQNISKIKRYWNKDFYFNNLFSEEDPNSVKSMTDQELSDMVDTILEEDDKDKDGYIDYSEFVMSQNNDED